jgi:serine/threonine-protein kinase
MSDPITRLNAALEGRYTIERELGEGGMATVYLADDLKHERKVALKVLKPELAAVVGAERFLAEIKTTANLQHPHILPLFDSGEADGFLFYVMPYVEGETLRDRLDRERQLPVDDAVKITADLAEALDYAHRHKIIHRDIKPANILMHEGRPLIADFGIALAVGAAGGGRLTETGLSLGTPFYMSPEQATGDQFVGSATDTYALGAVLYEMLTGDPPYMGSTAQAVLGQIIAGEAVSATKKRASVPANVDAALRCALEKLPADRFTSAQDFVRALGDEHFRYGELATVGAGDAVGPWNRLTLAMTTLAALLALTLGWSLLRTEPPAPVIRVAVVVPEEQAFRASAETFDLSRDGSFMVYRGSNAGVSQLWLRRWDALDAAPIPGTIGTNQPAISPDGREVAFDIGGSIRVVPLDGGVSRTLADDVVCCVRWSPDGAWVYYLGQARGLNRVPSDGGSPEVVTRVNDAVGEVGHVFVDPLPGGRAALYTAQGSEGSRIQVVDLETGEIKDLTAGTYPRYSPTGHLLFVEADGSNLLAAPFDAERLELTGTAVPVVEGLQQHALGYQFYALSQSGRLVYRTGSGGGVHTPVWVERDGAVRVVDAGWEFSGDADLSSLAVSPDGNRLATSITDSDGTTDLWVKQLDTGPLFRLRFDGTENLRAVWSQDGQFVTFVSNRAGQRDLWRKRADGSGQAELVLDRERPIQEFAFTPDGTWLVFVESDGRIVNGDIFAIRPGVDSVATSLITGEGSFLGEMSLSPDGRWLAYNQQGQVWVRPFPDVNAGLWQISTVRGDEPVWAHNGRELFYQGGPSPGEQMVAEIIVDPSFAVGQQRVLFSLTPYLVGNGWAGYDMSPDDQRAMLLMAVEGEDDRQLILVENFFEELRERVDN